MRYGVLFDEPLADYHESAALSHSKIEFFRDNFPSDFRRKYITREMKAEAEKKHFIIGNAVECLVSYGEEQFAKQYVVAPETYPAPKSKKKDAPIVQKPWNWNANYCIEWADLHCDAGAIVLSSEEAVLIRRMHDAVMRNPDAVALIRASKPQVTFRTKGSALSVQCRTDFWCPNGIVLPSTGEETGPFEADLKTIESLAPSAFLAFDRQAYDLGYHRAQAFYRMVIRKVLAEIAGVSETELPYVKRFFIVVDKREFPSCTVYTMPQPLVEQGEIELLGSSEVRGTIARLLECYRSNEWPDAPVSAEVTLPNQLTRPGIWG